jgi:hypothetical protein
VVGLNSTCSLTSLAIVTSVPRTSWTSTFSASRAVDVGVVAVALVGQLLHRVVVEVAAAEAEDGEEHAALALVLDALDELLVAGQADVEVAVGREDDAVDAVLDEVLAGLRVGEGDAGAAVGRAAGWRALSSASRIVCLSVAGGRREHQAGRAGVDDDRDAVLGVHVVDQAQAVLAAAAACPRLGHRARHVDQEHEVARAELLRQTLPCRPIVHELVAVRSTGTARPRRDRERPVVGRLRSRSRSN